MYNLQVPVACLVVQHSRTELEKPLGAARGRLGGGHLRLFSCRAGATIHVCDITHLWCVARSFYNSCSIFAQYTHTVHYAKMLLTESPSN